MQKLSKNFSRIKYGHPEGYLDAFSNIYKEFAESLLSNRSKKYFYPNEYEGLETAKFINACKISSKNKEMGKNMINVALFGLGRIGQMHAENLFNNKSFKLKFVYDVDYKLTQKFQKNLIVMGLKIIKLQ